MESAAAGTLAWRALPGPLAGREPYQTEPPTGVVLSP